MRKLLAVAVILFAVVPSSGCACLNHLLCCVGLCCPFGHVGHDCDYLGDGCEDGTTVYYEGGGPLGPGTLPGRVDVGPGTLPEPESIGPGMLDGRASRQRAAIQRTSTPADALTLPPAN